MPGILTAYQIFHVKKASGSNGISIWNRWDVDQSFLDDSSCSNRGYWYEFSSELTATMWI